MLEVRNTLGVGVVLEVFAVPELWVCCAWESWNQTWRLIIGANNSDYFIYVHRIKSLTVELKTKQEEMKAVKADLQYFQEEKEAAYKQSQVLRWDPKKKCWCWKCSISVVYKDWP